MGTCLMTDGREELEKIGTNEPGCVSSMWKQTNEVKNQEEGLH